MTTDLADVLGTSEAPNLEFKESVPDRKVIGQVICAFANDLPKCGGGDLLIGVNDAGEPVDLSITDRLLLTLTEYRDDGRIIDRPSMTVERAVFKGKEVVRIRVEASAAPPVRFDGTVYVRPGPTTRKAHREDERVLTERRRELSGPFDSHAVHSASIDDLDLALFRSTYLPSVVSLDVLEENGRPTDLQLASLRLTDPVGVPTVLGLLAIGLNPSAQIPGAYVQFVRYKGVDLDAPVADDQEIRGNVIDTAARLSAVLRGHLHTALVSMGDFREEERPDYPLEALREICMNAVMHRNYESSYAPVRIAWFDDRIEVTNPGGPFGQVNADNFERVNDYRNPSLAGAMKSMGYVNRFGRGIGRVRASLERNGNPPAEYVVDDASWLVVVRRQL
ncbi:ATP-binding protein [Lentzea sp. NPDC059081]|uniref:ATP-binding protein n=1 Tax=Lentzea sp. NPDC059081 TaxID=3346719 RepID=UPI0036AEA7A6